MDKIIKWLKSLENLFLNLMKAFLGKSSKIKKFKISIDGQSYTDLEHTVQISIRSNELQFLSKADIVRELKFLLYHECSHVLWTNKEAADELKERIYEIFLDEAKKQKKCFYKNIVLQIVHTLLNSIEDGRIENMLVLKKPGIKKIRDWANLRAWKTRSIAESDSKISVLIEAILSIAVTGLLPKGFTELYEEGSPLYDKVMCLCEPIGQYVTSSTIKEGQDAALKVADLIKEELIEEYALTQEEIDNESSLKGKQIPENLKTLVEKAIKDYENGNFGKDLQEEFAQNGPVVAILDDNVSETDGEESNVKPDVVIDLRKNPPKMESAEDNDEDAPVYIRPEQEIDGYMEEEDKEEKEDNKNDFNSSSQSPCNKENSSSENDLNETSNNEEDKISNDGSNEASKDNEDSKTSEGENKESSSGCSKETSKTEEEPSDAHTENTSKDDKNDTSSDGDSSSENDLSSDNDLNEPSKNTPSDSLKDEKTPKQSKEKAKKKTRDNSAKDKASQPPILPDPEEIEAMVDEKIDEAEEELFNEIKNDVSTINKMDADFTKSVDEANPLNDEEINKLSSKFNEYSNYGGAFNFIDYRQKAPSIKCPDDISKRANSLKSKLSDILEDKSEAARQELFFGDIDCTSLSKFISGRGDFFCEEGEEVSPDMACLIIKDDSGSMMGSNETTAIRVIAEIEEAFKGLEIPLRISTFSSTPTEKMKLIKDWEDCDKNRNYTIGFSKVSSPNDSNNDAYSIALATEIIAKRPEANKLLIVINDGAPCCDRTLVKNAVADARKKGIFVISILIGDQNYVNSQWETFKYMYEKYFFSSSLEKMGETLFGFLRKFIQEI